MNEETQKRKQAHLALSLDARVRGGNHGLEAVRLPFDAMFEVSPEALDMRTSIAHIAVSCPLMFGAMTGGTRQAKALNTHLRMLAKKHGLAMCLGSMRAALEDAEALETYGSGEVEALFSNIGASELLVYSAEQIGEMSKRMGASGVFVHLNGLQEYVQPRGNHAFSCRYDVLASFIERVGMPVLIKEVGSGLGGTCLQKLSQLPIAGVETAGRGGTSWVRLEALRRGDMRPECVSSLDALGYSTAESIVQARAASAEYTVIASGGIASPLDVVKSLALGADAAAVAQPLYQAYVEEGTCDALVEAWIDGMKLIFRSTGAANLSQLRKVCAPTLSL